MFISYIPDIIPLFLVILATIIYPQLKTAVITIHVRVKLYLLNPLNCGSLATLADYR